MVLNEPYGSATNLELYFPYRIAEILGLLV